MNDHQSRHVPTLMKLAKREPHLLSLLKAVQGVKGSPGFCSSTFTVEITNRVGAMFYPKSAPARFYPELAPSDGTMEPLGTWEECKAVTNELLQFLPECSPGCLCDLD